MGSLNRKIRGFISKFVLFKGSEDYWIKRYNIGGNSGKGSYNEYAAFKAEILNDFVSKNNVQSVIEYGCGDGNQLQYFKFPMYKGFDVSLKAIEICRKLFTGDELKSFSLMNEYNGERAELILSLDVLFHLVEEDVFEFYLKRLFNSSDKYVIIYSTNRNDFNAIDAPHVKHRNFTNWVEKNIADFKLVELIPNKIPKYKNVQGAFTEFYVYEKR